MRKHSGSATVAKRPPSGSKKRALPRVLFPIAFAALVACIGPETQASIANLVGGLPPDWLDGAVVNVEGHPGWTRGTFAVTADGTATYDVPLWAPPGRAGIQPNLALHYSSRAGDSQVGVGWSITGLSSITRCGRTRSIDGDGLGSVGWDDDTFCLDGQRLVPVDPQMIGGLTNRLRPLQNGTESIELVGERTNPTRFTVLHDNGIFYRYQQLVSGTGCEPSTDPSQPFGVEATASVLTYAWLLTEVGDLAGNMMDIHYEQVVHDMARDSGSPLGAFVAANCAPIEWHATDIRYTGHHTFGQGLRSTRLSYAPDGIEPSVRLVGGDRAGLVLATSEHLTGVTSYGPDRQAARSYVVSGVPSASTGRRLVTRVQECFPGTATCREPLEFDYQNAAAGDYLGARDLNMGSGVVVSSEGLRLPIDLVSTLSPNSAVAHADFDGDGADELLVPDTIANKWLVLRYRAAATPQLVADTIGVSASAPLIPFDFDGDGRSEVLTRSGPATDPLVGRRLRQAGSSGPSRSYVLDGPDLEVIGPCPTPVHFIRPIPPATTPPPSYLFLSELAGGADPDGRGFVHHFVECMAQTVVDLGPNQQRFFDLNWLGLGYRDTTTGGPSTEPVPFNTISLDGSGRSTTVYRQFLTPSHADPRTAALVELPPAAGTAADDGRLRSLNLDPSGTWVFLDVNGDGLTDALDILTQDPSSRWALRLNMGGFFGPPMPALPSSVDSLGYQGVASTDLRIADYNGDGRADLGVLAHGTSSTTGRLDLLMSSGSALDLGGRAPLPAGILVPGRGWPLTAVLDYDGDGMPDLQYGELSADGVHAGLHLRQIFRGQPDLLVTVRRSGERQVAATYDRAHVAAGTCSAPNTPVVCGASVTTVATHTDELGGVYHHVYAAPRFDVEGGGWLGFLRHTVYEPPTPAGELRLTDTFYQPPTDADFAPGLLPGERYLLTGRPRVTLHVVGAPRALTVTARFVEYAPAHGPYPIAEISAVHIREWRDASTAWSPPAPTDMPDLSVDGFPLPSAALLTRAIDRTFIFEPSMDFGNPRIVLEEIPGIGTTTVTLSQHVDLDHWLLAQVTRASVRSAPDGMAPYTRTSSFDWGYPDGRFPHLLRRMVREPEDRANLYQATELVRDDRGLVTETSVSNLTGDPTQTSTMELDPDEHMFPRRLVNALGHEQWVGIEPTLGVAVYATDPRGAPTRTAYDHFGRLRRSSGHGTSVDVHYNLLTDPSPRATSGMEIVRRPAAGGEDRSIVNQYGRSRERHVRGFSGWMVTGVTYDRLGRVQTVVAPRYESDSHRTTRTFTYDALDRVTRIDFGDGGPPVTAFYKSNIAVVRDRRGHASTTIADFAGRLSLVLDEPADSSSPATFTKYTYGPFSNLRQVNDHRGFTWTWDRDSYGRRRGSHDPDAGDRHYTYDGFDRVREETDSDHVPFRTQYTYDALSRLTRIDSSVDGLVTMQWDTAANGTGLLASSERVNDGVPVTRAYAYDDVGRLARESTSVNHGAALQLDFGYDAGGRLETLTYPEVAGGRRQLTYEYDELSGQPVAVHDGRTTLWTGDAYDGQGRLTAETLGNGTHTAYRYGDDQPWLAQMQTADAAGHALMDVSYGYDPNGNVTSRADAVLGGPAEGYTYDGLSRLRTHTVAHHPMEHFDYDDLGNLTNNNGTTQTYSPTVPHRLISTSSSRDPVITDTRGRIGSGPGFTASYTDFDLPTTMTSGSTSAAFRYDAGGERVTKRQGSETTTYVHGLFEQRQRGSGPATSTWNVTVGGRTVAQITSAASGRPTTSYVHADRLGSPTTVTDASGAVAERYSYGAFGARQRLNTRTFQPIDAPHAGPAPLGPVPPERDGFTSDQVDQELGAVNMRGRMYVPALGRFITPDPIVGSRNRQSWNAYSYALNNPATLVDPTGFQSEEAGDGAAGSGIGGYGASCSGPDCAGGIGGGGGGNGGGDETYCSGTGCLLGGGGASSGTSTASPAASTAPRSPTLQRLDSQVSESVGRDGTGHAQDGIEGGHRSEASVIGGGFFDTVSMGLSASTDPADFAMRLVGLAVPAVPGLVGAVYDFAHPEQAQTRRDQQLALAGHVIDRVRAGDIHDPAILRLLGQVGGIVAVAVTLHVPAEIAGVDGLLAVDTTLQVGLAEGVPAALTAEATAVAEGASGGGVRLTARASEGAGAPGGSTVLDEVVEPPASTPVGSRGAQREVVAANSPATIAGREYSGHALDRMQGRGLTPSVVDEAIQYGVSTPGSRLGTTRYFDPANGITVIVDTVSGRVVTTW